MLWTLLAHNKNSGASSPVTVVINAAGADLITATYARDNAHAATVSDNQGNTYLYTVTEVIDGGGFCAGRIAYCQNPVAASPMTVQLNLTVAGSICVQAWKNSAGYDKESPGGNSAASTTVQPGLSGVPTVANSLILTSGIIEQGPSGSTFSINSGFSIIDQVPWQAGNNYGNVAAYLIGSASINPTLTLNATPGGMAAITAVFKAASQPGSVYNQILSCDSDIRAELARQRKTQRDASARNGGEWRYQENSRLLTRETLKRA